MVLSVLRSWSVRAEKPRARHRRRVRRRRGGARRLRRELAGRQPPRPVRGVRGGDQRVRRPHLRRRRRTPLPDRGGRTRHDPSAAHRPRPGGARVPPEPRQRRRQARERRSAGSPRTSGRYASRRPCGRTSNTPARPWAYPSTSTDIDGTLERLGRAGLLAAGTVRNTATPTMLEAGYKINVIPGAAHAHSTAGRCPAPTGVPRPPSTHSGRRGRARDPRPHGRGVGAVGLPVVQAMGARCGRRIPRRWPCRTAWAVAPTRKRSPGSASPATDSRRCCCRGVPVPGHGPRGRRTGARRGPAVRRPGAGPVPARAEAGTHAVLPNGRTSGDCEPAFPTRAVTFRR